MSAINGTCQLYSLWNSLRYNDDWWIVNGILAIQCVKQSIEVKSHILLICMDFFHNS